MQLGASAMVVRQTRSIISNQFPFVGEWKAHIKIIIMMMQVNIVVKIVFADHLHLSTKNSANSQLEQHHTAQRTYLPPRADICSPDKCSLEKCAPLRMHRPITRHNQQTYILCFLSSFSLFNGNFNTVFIKHSAAGADKITHEMLQKLAKRSAKPKSNALRPYIVWDGCADMTRTSAGSDDDLITIAWVLLHRINSNSLSVRWEMSRNDS